MSIQTCAIDDCVSLASHYWFIGDWWLCGVHIAARGLHSADCDDSCPGPKSQPSAEQIGGANG